MEFPLMIRLKEFFGNREFIYDLRFYKIIFITI